MAAFMMIWTVVFQRAMPSASAGLAVTLRHQHQHLLGRPHDQRDHQESERESTRIGRECFMGITDQPIYHDTPDDRRHAVQDIAEETDGPIQARRAELGQVDAPEHAGGHAEDARQAEQFQRADDRVRHAPAQFADAGGQMGKESDVQANWPPCGSDERRRTRAASPPGRRSRA